MNTSVNNRPIVHLTARIKDTTYLIGTLRFQKSKQFSYFLVDRRNPKNECLFYDTGKIVSPLEHITWHSNKVHIKNKDNIAIEAFNYLNGPLILDQPILTPIYVESIYFDNIPPLMTFADFTPWQGSQIQEIFTANTSNGFSMIFILIPESKSTDSILKGIQFKNIPKDSHRTPQLADLIDNVHRAGRITLWENWAMLVIISPFLRILKSSMPGIIKKKGFRLVEYLYPQIPLTDLLIQTIN